MVTTFDCFKIRCCFSNATSRWSKGILRRIWCVTFSKYACITSYDQVEEEKDEYTIDIKISDPQKMGDGMGAYMVYRVRTKVWV